MAGSAKNCTSFLVLPTKVTLLQEEDKDMGHCSRRNAVLLPEQHHPFCTFRNSASEMLESEEMHCDDQACEAEGASWWCSDEQWRLRMPLTAHAFPDSQCPSIASTPRCDTIDHAFGMSNVDAGDNHKECMRFNNKQCSPDIGDHEITSEEASDVHEPTDAKALDSFNREIGTEAGTDPDSSGYSKTSNHNTPASRIHPAQQRANVYWWRLGRGASCGPHDDVAVAFIKYVQEHCQICAVDIKPTALARMRDLRALFHMLTEKRVVRMVCSSSESIHASKPHQLRKRPPVESIFGFSRLIVDEMDSFNDEVTRMVRDDVNRSISPPPRNVEKEKTYIHVCAVCRRVTVSRCIFLFCYHVMIPNLRPWTLRIADAGTPTDVALWSNRRALSTSSCVRYVPTYADVY